ncbi:hypothetical protein KY315_04605 [Candidatus Woesearchaeota archaeon]|nr:hypothetical protein [Candidatus Woesearchaeota archaeon]
MGGNLAKCQKCGVDIRSYSPMRKWCVECRHTISLEQAKTRKIARMNSQKI